MRALVNSANQVVNRYSYRPFGAHESVSETIPNPLRYNAREFDAATGLYYYRARWYDPAVHRFLSEDPAAEGTNMYAYVSNDPVNYTDPTGMYQQALRPCPRSEQGLIDAYMGKCEWGQTILLEGITVVAPPRADPRARTREGRTTPAGGIFFSFGSNGNDRSAPSQTQPTQTDSRPTCGRATASAALSLGLDVLTLYPGYAAWRAWRIAGNMQVQKAAGQLTASVLTNNARASAAREAFVGTATSGGAGVALNGLQTASEGANWRYAIPIWGTGERIGDALIACLIEDLP